ncbi:MAG: ring-cleaving dioxygenase [Lactobacillaceae bacterium]|jgi:glyoxalase family protein|nr:ring-cleaving dioxygenase [Lactobacillaceae bacterium]
MANEIRGLHHLTTITSDSPKIWNFWTNIMGLHLIKKTVNQDDVRTYHLYFTDDMGTGGSVLTFFDFPGIQKAQFGTDEISKTTFRVPNDASFEYWIERFKQFNIRYDEKIEELFGSKYLNFYDFDDQRYALISDENDHFNDITKPHAAWRDSEVDPQFAIQGLGPEFLTINDPKLLDAVITSVMGAEEKGREGDFTLYEFNNGGHGAQVITFLSRLIPRGVQGFGGPHHLAFLVDDKQALDYWIQRLNELGFQESGFVDRFYFKSNYFRPTPGILFELATNGPGFLLDETYEEAGHHLELPPFLEPYRSDIEKNLVPFNSGDENKA